MDVNGNKLFSPGEIDILKNEVKDKDLQALMLAILDDGEDPTDAAKAWLSANPDVLNVWLDGVTTKDGGDAVAAVKSSLGM